MSNNGYIEQEARNSISGSRSSATQDQEDKKASFRRTAWNAFKWFTNKTKALFKNMTSLETEGKQKVAKKLEGENNAMTLCYTQIINHIENLGISGVPSALNIPYLAMLGMALQYFGTRFLKTLQASGSADHAVSSAICKLLRYYTGASSDSRVPQQLSFAEGSGAVREMMSESARARSFGPSVTADTARSMASAGLFQSATDGRVRCAFCQGALEPGSLAEGESPMQLHAKEFPTCPFVLGMDVGNKPDLEMDSVSQSEQCSEASEMSTEVVTEPQTEDEWRSLAMSDGSTGRPTVTLSEPEILAAVSQTSLPPPQTLRSAAEPRAVQALEMLELEASLLPIEHPGFVRQSDRLRTLENVELFEPADQVASAGFFLQTVGTFNLLICFACNLRLSVAGSQLLGNAWIAHAVWSPRCGHLLSRRGAAFVRRVRQFVAPDVVARFSEVLSSSRNHGQQDEQQSQVKMSYSGNLGVRYRIEAREIRARSDVPSARMAIRLGFSAAEVRTAMEMRLMFVGDDFATSDQLLAAVVSQHDVLTVRSMDIETFRESELHRLRSSSAFGEPEESPETDWRTCKVCMVHRINVILLDCGHLCCCSRCSANLQTCPICRKVIRAEAPVRFE
ncbi:hypothetical protein BOX15_Mlig032757g1 [Macrostomum lignano]|uniref:RING-type domain-containing protein n=2 Tax=Macrostomum lignano TaxID=282301 RepID=A0A267H1U1_9PLAT|nr:hypothetical protein BOX15_Mlig032757g1 [Macrostomum lignano]